MTGPEHYAEAERFLAALGGRDGVPAHQHAAVVAVAEVHATLALTAATIETAAARGPGDVSAAWATAVSA